MFDTPYNREVSRKMAQLNRSYAHHVGDVGDGAGISGGILTGGARRRHHKRGGEFELEGGNFLDILKAPFKLIGLGEDAEGAALSGGRKRVHRGRRMPKRRGGEDMVEGGSIFDLVKLPLKLIGLGEGAEGAALSGGRRRRHKRGGILTGGEDMPEGYGVSGGILTGGRRRQHKRGGNELVRKAMDIANMFYDPISDTPLAKIVGPEAVSAFKDIGSDVIGHALGLGRKRVHHKKGSAGTRAAAAQNPWIAHVKKFAAQHGISYREALRSPACKSSYRG